MARNINSKTSLETIKWSAQNDFGQIITDEQAKIIKKAQKAGALLWSSSGITVTLLDSSDLRVTREGVWG